MEENPNNPTIHRGEKINVQHHFIIRYKSDSEKKRMRDIILRLINEHELGDFYIEETEAYQNNRILYNDHTIFDNQHNTYVHADAKFTKHLHY